MKKIALAFTGLILALVLLCAGCSPEKQAGQAGVVALHFRELMDEDNNLSLRVRELDGKKVSITGFMAMQSPLDGSFVYLTNMPLVVCPYCIPGTNTLLNAIPAIAPAGKPIKYTEQPVTVIGVLEIGEKKDFFGYTTPLRINVESIAVADAGKLSPSLKEYAMLASDGVIMEVLLLLDQLVTYTSYDLSELDPAMLYAVDLEKIDGLMGKVRGYGVPSYGGLIDILQGARELAVELNQLMESGRQEEMINFAAEGAFLWRAYFAWADEMATLD